MLHIDDRLRRELAQTADDLIPFEMRRATAIPREDAESLIRHYYTFAPWHPDEIARDLIDKFGAEGIEFYTLAWDGGAGEDETFPYWFVRSDHLAAFGDAGLDVGTEPDPLSGELEISSVDEPARYESFNRNWVPADRLLIGLMDDARHDGWQPSAQIASALDRLEQIATAKRDELEAMHQAERRAQNEADEDDEPDLSDQEMAGIAARLAAFRQKNGLSPGPITPLVAMPLPDHPNLTVQQAVALEDFFAYLPQHTYIFTPTREMWPASSVNARIPPVTVPMRPNPITPASWLDANRSVEQMTWAPGRPMEIKDSLIADGGWIVRPGCTTFNLYRVPTIKPNAGDASPWLDHVRYVFGDDADHIVRWLAHRVQRPDQKINHALVLGGAQGIGKDSLIEPVKQAVGPWNFNEVSPQQMLGRFNGFVKSVVLRVSEARDLGDTDRYGFYELMKTLTAAPPDVLRVDEKHTREHAVLNVCGVIITTNNKDSLHLPSDDRRHFVAWSTRTKEDFAPDYWTNLYRWFGNGGNEIVAHYLAHLDLSGFDAKAPPPKTQAFWEIVDSSRAPEDAEMADAIDALGKPRAVTIAGILTKVHPEFGEWLRDRRNRRKIPHRLEQCGYVPVRNPSASDGHWVVNKKRVAIYALRELSLRDQLTASEQIARITSPPA